MSAPLHAVYAPSAAHRWMACTASAEAIAALGEQEEGEEAAAGTAAHDELERCLGPQCETRGGNSVLPLPLDPDHPAAYCVALALDYVRQLPPGIMWVEQRVRLTEQIWGRCDVAHWDAASDTLTIVDLKNGFVDMQAEANEQLQIYAAASIFTHNLPARYVRLVVVQPNSIVPGPRVKQWITTAAELHAFAARAAAIPDGPKTFAAGEQCKYCPLFGRCPASQDVLTRLGTMLANPPDAVPAGQVATFKACEKPLKDWFAALDKDQTKRALGGAVPPGMKLVTTTTRRAWNDEDLARAAVMAAAGIEALVPPTPAQAEKLGIDVSALASAPPGGPALAFESDKRPAWAPKSVAEMFALRTEDAA